MLLKSISKHNNNKLENIRKRERKQKVQKKKCKVKKKTEYYVVFLIITT